MTSLLLFLTAMFLHELGHGGMALVLGVKCYRIQWVKWHGIPFALGLARDQHPNRFLDGCITIAGPLTSLLFCLVACIDHRFIFARANAAILLFGFLLPGGDFWRLFEYSGLKSKALINRRLAEVCR